MGMFDTITVKAKMPNSWPEDEKPVFQTKDLECLMFDYEIREDNKLYVERVKYKEAERSKKESEHWLDSFPLMERESSEWEFSPVTGYIVFYTSIEDNTRWLEYRAHIVCGIVLSIEDFTYCQEGDTNNLSFDDDLIKTRNLIKALAIAKDHYYDSFIKRHNIGESEAENYLFDFCFNGFGSIENIKESLK